LGPAHRAMQDGDLARARRVIARANRMSHSTLGLIGFGRSAVHTARRARGFGMRVLATRSRPDAPHDEADALGVTMTDLETVLRESDYVSLHVPMTKRTENMIDAAALAKMKPEAVLINPSRGRRVDEAALHRALVEDRIAGAGIDTWGAIDIFVDRIAPPLTPLAALDNVILSPHTAGQSVQASFDMMDAGVANLVALRAGQMPAQETIVNLEVRARFRFKGQAR
ncbi:MAG: NAD(P)-dependent oxidoreductase, partial [Alphaproteobacteria bacterium]